MTSKSKFKNIEMAKVEFLTNSLIKNFGLKSLKSIFLLNLEDDFEIHPIFHHQTLLYMNWRDVVSVLLGIKQPKPVLIPLPKGNKQPVKK